MTDDQLLDSLPEHVSFGAMLKATPSEEAGQRFIYVEASNESRDLQGEIVLSKALKESVGIFQKFGVIDLDHKSMPSVAKQHGIEYPEEWIVGRPVDVRFNGSTTFVKAQLRQGDTSLAHRANMVWDGLVKVSPPDRYFASVGGSVLGREVRIDPETKERVAVITKTRWNNLALSLNPVNPDLNPATTTPVGVFTKSLNGFVISKSLSAGYGTDSATLSGGAALRMQSLDAGQVFNYWDFRDQFARLWSAKKIGSTKAGDLVRTAQSKFGLAADVAAEYVERFLSDLKRGLNQRGNK